MALQSLPEVWLRGALPGVLPGLQPVAHALLQAKEEINAMMTGFPEQLLWEKPAGLASPGFHLQHITGVLQRLFTYADGKQLSEAQVAYLKEEGSQVNNLSGLLNALNNQVEEATESLKNRREEDLTDAREVGRGRLPSTVLGLLFHAAEHTMRHTGQLLVTVTILKSGYGSKR